MVECNKNKILYLLKLGIKKILIKKIAFMEEFKGCFSDGVNEEKQINFLQILIRRIDQLNEMSEKELNDEILWSDKDYLKIKKDVEKFRNKENV